jgi:hypothetical protein
MLFPCQAQSAILSLLAEQTKNRQRYEKAGHHHYLTVVCEYGICQKEQRVSNKIGEWWN